MDFSDPNLTPQELLKGCRRSPREVLANTSLGLILLEDAAVYHEIVIRSRYSILRDHFTLAFAYNHWAWPPKKDIEAVAAIIECFGDVGLYHGYIKPLTQGWRLPSFVISDVMGVFAAGMERNVVDGDLLGPPFHDYIDITDRIARVYPPLEPESLPTKADFPW